MNFTITDKKKIIRFITGIKIVDKQINVGIAVIASKDNQ